MARVQKALSGKGQPQKIKRFSLPIGMRLSLAFMAIILLTGLIGILAIQQISSLTNTATEINSHDLPEVIILVQLNSLLYRQRDLELGLLNGDSPNGATSPISAQQATSTTENDRQHFRAIVTPSSPGPTPTTNANHVLSRQTQQTLSELAVVLKDIDADGHQLLAFERSEQKDFAVVQKIADDILKTGALSVRLQALVKQAHFAQARTLDLRQQEPLLLSTIAAVTQFGTIEQTEGASDTAQTQQDSGRSILFVFALTTLGVLLSIILAIILHAH